MQGSPPQPLSPLAPLLLVLLVLSVPFAHAAAQTRSTSAPHPPPLITSTPKALRSLSPKSLPPAGSESHNHPALLSSSSSTVRDSGVRSSQHSQGQKAKILDASSAPGHSDAKTQKTIAITKERIGPAARWDDSSGKAIDSEIKGKSDSELQYAIMGLAGVAATIICGGAGVVACCWKHRERGFIRGSSKYQQVDGNKEEGSSPNKYQGGGSKWLQPPV